jgi:hypothetical protein
VVEVKGFKYPGLIDDSPTAWQTIAFRCDVLGSQYKLRCSSIEKRVMGQHEVRRSPNNAAF